MWMGGLRSSRAAMARRGPAQPRRGEAPGCLLAQRRAGTPSGALGRTRVVPTGDELKASLEELNSGPMADAHQ